MKNQYNARSESEQTLLIGNKQIKSEIQINWFLFTQFGLNYAFKNRFLFIDAWSYLHIFVNAWIDGQSNICMLNWCWVCKCKVDDPHIAPLSLLHRRFSWSFFASLIEIQYSVWRLGLRLYSCPKPGLCFLFP